QRAPPSETGKDVVRAQLSPDGREIPHARRVEAPSEEGRVERAGGRADEEIRLDAGLQDRVEHPDLQRSQARPTREDEGNRSRTARPFHEDQSSDGRGSHSPFCFSQPRLYSAISRQPLSMVSEWPRPANSFSSVTAGDSR